MTYVGVIRQSDPQHLISFTFYNLADFSIHKFVFLCVPHVSQLACQLLFHRHWCVKSLTESPAEVHSLLMASFLSWFYFGEKFGVYGKFSLPPI